MPETAPKRASSQPTLGTLLDRLEPDTTAWVSRWAGILDALRNVPRKQWKLLSPDERTALQMRTMATAPAAMDASLPLSEFFMRYPGSHWDCDSEGPPDESPCVLFGVGAWHAALFWNLVDGAFELWRSGIQEIEQWLNATAYGRSKLLLNRISKDNLAEFYRLRFHRLSSGSRGIASGIRPFGDIYELSTAAAKKLLPPACSVVIEENDSHLFEALEFLAALTEAKPLAPTQRQAETITERVRRWRLPHSVGTKYRAYFLTSRNPRRRWRELAEVFHFHAYAYQEDHPQRAADTSSRIHLEDARNALKRGQRLLKCFDRHGVADHPSTSSAMEKFGASLGHSGFVMRDFDGPLFDRGPMHWLFVRDQAPKIIRASNLLTLRMFFHTLARGHRATWSGSGYPYFDRAYESGGLAALLDRLACLVAFSEEAASAYLIDDSSAEASEITI